MHRLVSGFLNMVLKIAIFTMGILSTSYELALSAFTFLAVIPSCDFFALLSLITSHHLPDISV